MNYWEQMMEGNKIISDPGLDPSDYWIQLIEQGLKQQLKDPTSSPLALTIPAEPFLISDLNDLPEATQPETITDGNEAEKAMTDQVVQTTIQDIDTPLFEWCVSHISELQVEFNSRKIYVTNGGPKVTFTIRPSDMMILLKVEGNDAKNPYPIEIPLMQSIINGISADFRHNLNPINFDSNKDIILSLIADYLQLIAIERFNIKNERSLATENQIHYAMAIAERLNLEAELESLPKLKSEYSNFIYTHQADYKSTKKF